METHAILADDREQYQKEQDQILNTILTYRFFNPWKGIKTVSDDFNLSRDSNLEIYITNTCNQNCEYCYLTKYPELYPADKNNPTNILNNLKILYDYITINRFHIPTLDVFSGEIWHTQLGLDFLEITLEYIQKGMLIDNVLIASNCFFVNDNETLIKIQNIIDKYKQAGHSIVFSASVDGKIIDDYIRPRNDNNLTYTDDFYERLFTFAKINGYGFHPMLSASNIKYWKENYLWWKKMCEYYDMNILTAIMILEVRNSDWTEEALNDFKEFLIFLADDVIKNNCQNNIQIFADNIANIRLEENSPTHLHLNGYYLWILNKADNFLGCTVSNHLTVRLGDLAICPCHRQAYDKYLYGYFNVENNCITGIRAVNPYMAIKILMGNIHTSMPLCDTCLWNKTCSHGCYGSQIEYHSDPFFPIENVCKMMNVKYRTLLQYYRDKGIIDYYKTISPKEFNTDYVYFILELDQQEKEASKNELE